ncbi:unnamed protein product [Ixodes pacificus]
MGKFFCSETAPLQSIDSNEGVHFSFFIGQLVYSELCVSFLRCNLLLVIERRFEKYTLLRLIRTPEFRSSLERRLSISHMARGDRIYMTSSSPLKLKTRLEKIRGGGLNIFRKSNQPTGLITHPEL